MRTAFVSVNMFSLLCSGGGVISPSAYANIKRYGGPILYLIVYSFVLFAILVWVDSGSILPRNVSNRKIRAQHSAVHPDEEKELKEDVMDEAKAVAVSDDPLRVLGVSKAFGRGKKVVDGVSLGVGRGTIFALLGPNGAGKTTTFNMIRESFFIYHV